MYEIWSLGHKPYEAYRNAEVRAMHDQYYNVPLAIHNPQPVTYGNSLGKNEKSTIVFANPVTVWCFDCSLR